MERAGSAQAFAFDNSYSALPARFFARVKPTPVAAPTLIRINEGLARELGLDPQWLASPAVVSALAGNDVPESADPIAMAYAGHQFGGFVPQLGDGRAILLGEIVDQRGERRDIQLKGAGQTPFSRRGDGRAALGPVLREYLVSEAFAALGIPTTRALAAVATGDRVYRETALPGAILTRVAASHVRVGTFQYFAARGDTEGLRLLADYCIARHYREVGEGETRYADFLSAVIDRQARLIARWMLVGFIHGVMNTDNMAISGETIDFGPCAFLDDYDPAKVYSSIDHGGRYAYANQPRIALWNLTRLAETLLPLLDPVPDAAVAVAQARLDAFADTFTKAYTEGLAAKIGLDGADPEGSGMAQDLLDRMAANKADFTLTFRRLAASAETGDDGPVRELFADPAAFDDWSPAWRTRIEAQGGKATADRMRRINPAYIPRNHLVEDVIAAAVVSKDFAPFERLLAVLAQPFDEVPGTERYMAPPRPEEVVLATFCGT